MKEWITGRNPVYECLRANRRQFFRLLAAKGIEQGGRVTEIFALAQSHKLTVEWVERRDLENLYENHQGIALEVSGYPYVDLTDIFGLVERKREKLFLLLLDQIQDPQNFGTLIRSAELFGVNGIVIPSSRAVGVTPAVVNASSGGSEHLFIAQGNLAQDIDQIKARDAWVYGLDMGGKSRAISECDLKGNIAIVVGSEGFGLRRLVRDQCDIITHIPTRGKLDSLNASVAGSIALYTAFLQRHA